MVEAITPFLKSNPSYKLVCTANEFDKNELAAFSQLGVSRQIQHVLHHMKNCCLCINMQKRLFILHCMRALEYRFWKHML